MSKYTGQRSIKKIQVIGNGILSIVSDTSKLEQMEKRYTRNTLIYGFINSQNHSNTNHEITRFFRLHLLGEKREEILRKVKEFEEKMCTENKQLDTYRETRTKYQHDIQQIQALRNRISMASKKIKILENERTSREDIIAMHNKKIQVFVVYTHTY